MFPLLDVIVDNLALCIRLWNYKPCERPWEAIAQNHDALKE